MPIWQEVYILVRLAQETLQAEKDSLDVVCGRPLVLENVEADAARKVDVGVVDGRIEEHRGRGVGVVGGKGKAELHGEVGIWCSVGALDGGRPREQVAVGRGEGGHARRWRSHELHQLSLQAT